MRSLIPNIPPSKRDIIVMKMTVTEDIVVSWSRSKPNQKNFKLEGRNTNLHTLSCNSDDDDDDDLLQLYRPALYVQSCIRNR